MKRSIKDMKQEFIRRYSKAPEFIESNQTMLSFMLEVKIKDGQKFSDMNVIVNNKIPDRIINFSNKDHFMQIEIFFPEQIKMNGRLQNIVEV